MGGLPTQKRRLNMIIRRNGQGWRWRVMCWETQMAAGKARRQLDARRRAREAKKKIMESEEIS